MSFMKPNNPSKMHTIDLKLDPFHCMHLLPKIKTMESKGPTSFFSKRIRHIESLRNTRQKANLVLNRVFMKHRFQRDRRALIRDPEVFANSKVLQKNEKYRQKMAVHEYKPKEPRSNSHNSCYTTLKYLPNVTFKATEDSVRVEKDTLGSSPMFYPNKPPRCCHSVRNQNLHKIIVASRRKHKGTSSSFMLKAIYKKPVKELPSKEVVVCPEVKLSDIIQTPEEIPTPKVNNKLVKVTLKMMNPCRLKDSLAYKKSPHESFSELNINNSNVDNY